jgi:hypothetical protein
MTQVIREGTLRVVPILTNRMLVLSTPFLPKQVSEAKGWGAAADADY